ncbi:GCG_CRPN prefix-to-repeats domain-containing protein [Phyllobacterium endophyticum]|uniref:GCG_CRPN prefix-to-repeats domain-containing protein n=1 Tax=Phyllobacterium endophyticum TaxID=1149773 RepID=UPI003CCEF950
MSLKSGLSALVLLGGLVSFGTPAWSSPIMLVGGSPEVSGSVEQVGWRCGRGWHMNRWGRCVPNRRVTRCGPGRHMNRFGDCVRNRPAYRVCPRGFHLTRRGFCVPN